jgi:DcaP outer membrane protein
MKRTTMVDFRSGGRACFLPEIKLILTRSALVAMIAALVVFSGSAPASAVEVKLLDDQFTLKFYGFINSVVMYDTNGRQGIDWAFASRNSNLEDTSLEFNADNSRVGLLLTSAKEDDVSGSARAEFDFVTRSKGDTVRVRHLYTDFTIGKWTVLIDQTWSMLHNLEPATINTTNMFAQGHLYDRQPQLRISRGFGDWMVNLIAIQQDNMGDIIDSAGITTAGTIKPDQPNIQADITYKTESFVGAVGGSVGRVRVEETASKIESKVTSWLVGAEAGVFLPTGGDSKFSLIGKIFTGSGGGLSTGAFQFAVIDASGKAHAIDSSGGLVDLGLDLKKSHIHAIYGIDNPEDVVAGVSVDRKKNWTAIGNISHDLTKAINIGLEYQRVETEYTVSTKNTDINNRVLASVYYKW